MGDSIDVAPMQDSLFSVLIMGSNGCDITDSTFVQVDSGGIADALPDSIELKAGSSANINVFGNDTGSLGNLALVDSSSEGSVEYVGSGSFSYSADDREGEDYFTYRICDGACLLECDTARVKVRITKDIELFIPNGVSADGDGINDRWKIRGLEAYPDHSVRIMNRWGEEVYRAAPYRNDWKGESANGDLVEGTYFYVLDLGPGEGKKTGFIELRR